MDANRNDQARGTIATVIATAAVTLALGVTAAALGGYLSTDRGADEPATMVEPAAVEPAAPTPTIVVVPVPAVAAPAPPPEPVPEAAPLLAAYDGYARDDDDHDDDDHDHDHDDDDEDDDD